MESHGPDWFFLQGLNENHLWGHVWFYLVRERLHVRQARRFLVELGALLGRMPEAFKIMLNNPAVPPQAKPAIYNLLVAEVVYNAAQVSMARRYRAVLDAFEICETEYLGCPVYMGTNEAGCALERGARGSGIQALATLATEVILPASGEFDHVVQVLSLAPGARPNGWDEFFQIRRQPNGLLSNLMTELCALCGDDAAKWAVACAARDDYLAGRAQFYDSIVRGA